MRFAIATEKDAKGDVRLALVKLMSQCIPHTAETIHPCGVT